MNVKLFIKDTNIGRGQITVKTSPRPSERSRGDRRRRRDSRIPRGIVARLFYRFCRFLLRMAAVVFLDYRQFGAMRCPGRGGVVLASNHLSYLDPILVGIGIPRSAYYLARDSLFKLFGFRQLISSVNAIPIPRKAICRQAIDKAREVVRQEQVLVLFPEGTRSRDGKLGPVKRGIDLIAGPTGATVVPAFIDGSYKVWPRGGGISFHPIRVFFGTPLEGEIPGADKKCTESAGSGEHGDEKELSADLVARLTASYRNLEARARRIRRVEAARSEGQLRYFG